ncbi:hypothetical protein AB0271_01980 [Kocuria palustris]|uniref:hypothetical protein n=1 Tax=Kocuria palustris TaxID=71999 RepID=UPI00344D4ED1
MPHNSIPGHGEFHETPAAGTPTAIAAQHAGTTADAYAAEHSQPAISDPHAAARGPLGDDRSGAGSADRRGGRRRAGRSPWYDDDRFGLAVSGIVIIGGLVAAWYIHRADED